LRLWVLGGIGDEGTRRFEIEGMLFLHAQLQGVSNAGRSPIVLRH